MFDYIHSFKIHHIEAQEATLPIWDCLSFISTKIGLDLYIVGGICRSILYSNSGDIGQSSVGFQKVLDVDLCSPGVLDPNNGGFTMGDPKVWLASIGTTDYFYNEKLQVVQWVQVWENSIYNMSLSIFRQELCYPEHSREPQVVWNGSWFTDWVRRDFYANSIYIRITNYRQTNHKKNILWFEALSAKGPGAWIGKPSLRIAEDPLRVFRLARFTNLPQVGLLFRQANVDTIDWLVFDSYKHKLSWHVIWQEFGKWANFWLAQENLCWSASCHVSWCLWTKALAIWLDTPIRVSWEQFQFYATNIHAQARNMDGKNLEVCGGCGLWVLVCCL
jgi:hypothetical protein